MRAGVGLRVTTYVYGNRKSNSKRTAGVQHFKRPHISIRLCVTRSLLVDKEAFRGMGRGGGSRSKNNGPRAARGSNAVAKGLIGV